MTDFDGTVTGPNVFGWDFKPNPVFPQATGVFLSENPDSVDVEL